MKKMEMPLVIFDDSLYNTHAILCSKTAVGHAIEVHEVQTSRFVDFQQIFHFLLCITCI